MTLKSLKIGTRASPLALKQTEMVCEALQGVQPDLQIEIVKIESSGEWKPEQGEMRLSSAAGGKGQFAKELEEALLAGTIDAAVHSMKDMDSHLPQGLVIPFMLPREDPRDLLIISELSKNSQKDFGLAERAMVGTASVRRQAFLMNKRPDLKVVPFRGNVGTRLEKLQNGQVDATLLAVAGLRRLGREDVIERGRILEPEEMLPAAGQGAVGIEIREDDLEKLAIFSQISCTETLKCVSAERAALAFLDGSCHTPIGAHATLEGEMMRLQLAVVALDGSDAYYEQGSRSIRSCELAESFGTELAQTLKAQMPPNLLLQKIED